MQSQTEISTQRLVLTSITPVLIQELFRTKSQQEIKLFFGVDEAGYAHFKEMNEKGMETHRFSLYFFLLTEKHSREPIGDCGFHTWNTKHNRAELFYSLRKNEHKRKGFMTEALKPVLEFGFTKLNLHRIEALVAEWNTPSVKLLQRFGFTKEGTMREDYLENGKHGDSDCYSLLKWEWEKNKPATEL